MKPTQILRPLSIFNFNFSNHEGGNDPDCSTLNEPGGSGNDPEINGGDGTGGGKCHGGDNSGGDKCFGGDMGGGGIFETRTNLLFNNQTDGGGDSGDDKNQKTEINLNSGITSTTNNKPFKVKEIDAHELIEKTNRGTERFADNYENVFGALKNTQKINMLDSKLGWS